MTPEYDQYLIESYTKAAEEHEAEREKHRIPVKDQIWHIDYDPDGDEDGYYDEEIYAGTITLFGPFYGFDDYGTQTIEVSTEDDAKFLVERLNKLIELEAVPAQLEAARRETRIEALKEAAMNVCGNCSQSKFPFFEATYSCYSHVWFNARGVRNVETCLASNIWELREKLLAASEKPASGQAGGE